MSGAPEEAPTLTAQPFLARAPLAVVRVTGGDRVSYLDDVTTQQLAGVEPGRWVGALQLDAKGNVEAVMDVVVRSDDLLLLVPEDLVTHVLEVLGGRTFLLDATFEVTDHVIEAVRGLDGQPAVAAALGAAPSDGEVAEVDEVLVIGRAGGCDLVGAPAAVEDRVRRLEDAGSTRGDGSALDDWRIRRGLPRWGREITPGRLPEELGLLPSHVHLGKGCYPGQEAVARMWMLGKPRRRLALVSVAGPVPAGWEAGSGRERAVVTSVTETGDAALAFVPYGTEPGDRFGDDDAAIIVERLVGDTLDVPGHDPAVTRRRDRRTSGAGAQ